MGKIAPPTDDARYHILHKPYRQQQLFSTVRESLNLRKPTA